MTALHRNLAPRRPARIETAPITLDPVEFDDLDFGEDTNPNLQLPVERPTRHATGTPVPQVPAPQAYAKPTRVERPARVERPRTASPWEESSSGARPVASSPRPGTVRASSPSNYEIVAGVTGPRPQRATGSPLPARQRSVAAPLPTQRSVASPLPAPLPPAPQPPQPQVAAPQPQPQAQAPQAALPPELAAPVYGLTRRLALQTELQAADRVLRVGLAELIDATTVVSRFVDAEGQPWALEDQGTCPIGDPLLARIAAAAMPVCEGHLFVQPIVAAGKTVALLICNRNERLAPFGVLERAVGFLVARECAGLMHQLLGDHAQREREAAADAKSLFRPEALESHRSKGTEGALMNLSPVWVRRAYPICIGIVLVAIGFAIFAKVPTYSAGPVVITVDGLDVTAPAPGTVESVRVDANDRVAVGDELARLYSVQEKAELDQATSEYRNALTTFLVDNDDNAKQALAQVAAKRDRALAVVEARTVRASQAGIVSDVRVRPGQNLNPGDHILTIVPEDAEPVVIALLPGQDRPRLRAGMPLQVELKGFIKPREKVIITEVGSEVIGPNEARRALGAQFADAVELKGPVVIVKAKLTKRTFEAQHHVYHFHNGLHGNGEVRIEEKPFLVTLIPAIEKVLY